MLKQGMTDFKGGNYDKALDDYTQAIALYPQDAQAYFRRAFVYMTTSKDDEAVTDLTQAITLNPRFGQAYFRRAFVYMIQGNYDAAIDDLNHTIEIEPKFTKAYYRRANAAMMAGKYDLAISDLEQVIKLEPNFGQATTKRCFMYMLKGDYAGAIANISQVIQDDPTNAMAYNQLAWLLATCPQPAFRDGKKAVENATTGCDLTEWKVSAQLDTLAAAYAESGDYTNAVKTENMAISAQGEKGPLDDQKARLALYESSQPYHVDKYVPKLEAIVN